MSNNEKVIYVSKSAFDVMKKRVEEVKQKVEKKRKDAELEDGDEWSKHNEALLHAQADYYSAQALLKQLEEDIQKFEIVEPNQNTDVVSLGNRVTVEYLDDGYIDDFTILGPYDAEVDPSYIPFTSPLAQALLGLTKGQKISFDVDSRKINVKVKDIKPGDF